MTRAMLMTLVLITLACNWAGPAAVSTSKRIIISTRLPTLTPTAGLITTPPPAANDAAAFHPIPSPPAAATPVPALNPTPLPALTPTPDTAVLAAPAAAAPTLSLPSPTAGPTTAPLPEISGWSFSGLRLYPDPWGEGLLLYGEALNNTGSTQALSLVSAAFYDAQGQLLVDVENAFGYWPVDIVPAGERLPFQVTVPGVRDAADFKPHIEAAPGDGMPRRDFEFGQVDQRSEEGSTCLAGQLQNSGSSLRDYLVIVAVFYDAQAQVAGFGEYYAPAVEEIQGGQSLDFELCVEPVNQEIARYELRAWGE